MYAAVHGVYGPGTRPYMIRTRPCTRPITVHTVVFKACTRPRERTVYTPVDGPCTVLSRVPCTRPSLRPVGRERTGYTAVHGPCALYTGVFTFTAHEHGTFYGPCTRPCTDLVRGHARAVYTAVNSRVHGQRPCSRSVHG